MIESRTYEDRRPYAVPLRLADLAGPAYGVVELPLTLASTARRNYDLKDPAATNIPYKRVIVEAATRPASGSCQRVTAASP